MASRNIHCLVTQLNFIQLSNLEGWSGKKMISLGIKRCYTIPSGTPGQGAGKGGGSGGSVRESGGGLGKYGAAQEEGYFFNKQRQLLEKIKEDQKKEPEQAAIKNKEEKGDN